MMQLAQMNGRLRPQDIIFRWKSGLVGSAEYGAPTLTSQITCTQCGGGGHIASDCKVDLSSLAPGDVPTAGSAPIDVVDKAKIDSEYLSLMKELGEVVHGADSAPKPVSSNPIASGTAVPPPSSLPFRLVAVSCSQGQHRIMLQPPHSYSNCCFTDVLPLPRASSTVSMGWSAVSDPTWSHGTCSAYL